GRRPRRRPRHERASRETFRKKREAAAPKTRRRRKPSIETEDEHGGAVFVVELIIAARRDGNIGLAVDLKSHRRGVDAGARREGPQALAALGVIGGESAVTLAGEDEPALGGERAADHRLIGLDLPGDLAGIDIDGRDVARLLLAGDGDEGAAEPHIWRLGVARAVVPPGL